MRCQLVEPLHHTQGRAGVGVGQQDDELVAADAADAVIGSQRTPQQLDQPFQHPIAGTMAMRVVERLEMVDVEVEQAQGLRLAQRAGRLGLEFGQQSAARQRAGQRVGVCGVAQRGEGGVERQVDGPTVALLELEPADALAQAPDLRVVDRVGGPWQAGAVGLVDEAHAIAVALARHLAEQQVVRGVQPALEDAELQVAAEQGAGMNLRLAGRDVQCHQLEPTHQRGVTAHHAAVAVAAGLEGEEIEPARSNLEAWAIAVPAFHHGHADAGLHLLRVAVALRPVEQMVQLLDGIPAFGPVVVVAIGVARRQQCEAGAGALDAEQQRALHLYRGGRPLRFVGHHLESLSGPAQATLSGSRSASQPMPAPIQRASKRRRQPCGALSRAPQR